MNHIFAYKCMSLIHPVIAVSHTDQQPVSSVCTSLWKVTVVTANPSTALPPPATFLLATLTSCSIPLLAPCARKIYFNIILKFFLCLLPRDSSIRINSYIFFSFPPCVLHVPPTLQLRRCRRYKCLLKHFK